MTATTIPTRPSRYGDPGHFEGAASIRIGNRTYGVGGWDETGTGRLVDRGPLVPGPVAYAYARAAIIADTPISFGREIECSMGDVVSINGHDYTIAPERNHNINLIPA